VVFKRSAIHFKDGNLILSNGKKQALMVIKGCCLKGVPKYAELIFHQGKKKYYLHIVVEVEEGKMESTKSKNPSMDV